MFAAETANAKAPKTQTNVGRAEREFILHLVQLKASRRFKATAALGRNTPVRGRATWGLDASLQFERSCKKLDAWPCLTLCSEVALPGAQFDHEW